MATVIGYEGTVKIGSTSVGEIRGFEYETSADLQDTSTLGSGFARRRATLKSAKGSVSCFFDGSNVQQNQMVEGASVTLILVHTDGVQKTFPVVIESVKVDQGGPSGIVQRDFTWQSNGAWT